MTIKEIKKNPNIVHFGFCSNYVVWTLSKSGVLRIYSEKLAERKNKNTTNWNWNIIDYLEKNEREEFIQKIKKIVFVPYDGDNYVIIKAECFAGCTNLQSVDFGDVRCIHRGVFRGCTNLKKIKAPCLERISHNSFEGCVSLEEVNAPNLARIGVGAFKGCKNLEKVTTKSECIVSTGAFSGCEKLRIFKSGKADLSDLAFSGCPINKLSPKWRAICEGTHNFKILEEV